jgi:hypothetical protein
MPLAELIAIHMGTVMSKAYVDPPSIIRGVRLSTWQPSADQPVGMADAAMGVGVPVTAAEKVVGAVGDRYTFSL